MLCKMVAVQDVVQDAVSKMLCKMVSVQDVV